MSETGTGRPDPGLVLEYQLDAPPEKVWRAISTPELRERWLPSRDLAADEPVSTVPGAAGTEETGSSAARSRDGSQRSRSPGVLIARQTFSGGASSWYSRTSPPGGPPVPVSLIRPCPR